MANVVKPIVRLFFPCDDAVIDLADMKWKLTNPWHTVGMPPGVTEKFSQEVIWLYAQLTDGVATSISWWSCETPRRVRELVGVTRSGGASRAVTS